jgi:branched-chain amino acid transport system substrate-binding protein
MRWLRSRRCPASWFAGLLVTTLLASGAFAADVIKIGAPLALTGALADSGNKQKLGFDLWLERIKRPVASKSAA